MPERDRFVSSCAPVYVLSELELDGFPAAPENVLELISVTRENDLLDAPTLAELKSNPAVPGLVWPLKRALQVPGKTPMVS